MSKVQEFIASGILNEYCLGLLKPDEIAEVERMARLHPEVEQAIEHLRRALSPLEQQRAEPDEKLRNRILDALDELGEPPILGLNNLPLIHPYSDSEQWQRTVASIQPSREFNNLYVHALKAQDGVDQCIVWVKQNVKPEAHHNERESFLILEGECECRIGPETVRLSAGDYVEIPLHVEHTVEVLSAKPV